MAPGAAELSARLQKLLLRFVTTVARPLWICKVEQLVATMEGRIKKSGLRCILVQFTQIKETLEPLGPGGLQGFVGCRFQGSVPKEDAETLLSFAAAVWRRMRKMMWEDG